MASKRWRAATRASYAIALRDVIIYARAHPEPDFAFGPIDLNALEEQGIVVSGEDLTGVSDVLAKVPGLTEVPA